MNLLDKKPNGHIPQYELLEAMRENTEVTGSPQDIDGEKLALAIRLPFNPHLTKTEAVLEKFSNLDIDWIQRNTRGVITDLYGTLLAHNAKRIPEENMAVLAEIKKYKPLVVHSRSRYPHQDIVRLGIKTAQNIPQKPNGNGFTTIPNLYFNEPPEKCVMIGNNILTDGGCRQVGMPFILVQPIPGDEKLIHQITRGYARTVKKFHDRYFR